MNSNPLRYQGVVRNDEDDISVTREEEQPNIKSTSINSNGEKAASTIGLINAYSGTIVAILCIIILALVANINKNIANSTYSYSTGGRATLVDVGSLHAIGSTASPLQLYRSETPDALYCRIAQSLVDTNAPMMMYEQLTSGIGVRELYWDAGTIISSDIVRFQKGESTKLQLITVQQGYRGDPSVVQRSFSDPVIWAFDILDVNLDGFLIDMSEFALASIGHIHNNDLSVVIAAAFGQRYVYAVDVERSFIDTLSSDANAYRMKMGRNITYVLSSAIPPPAPLGKTISLSSRRSFVLLDQYHSASTAASSSRTGESNHMRSIAGTISGAKLPAIGTTVPEYTPRPYHPMSGFNSITFMNESSGLLEARHESFLVRHFLVQSEDTAPQGETNTKTSPTHHTRDQVVSAEATAPFTQIVYYVDEDTPPGIREALVEGISWWDEAFQYAGYPKDTFIVQTTNRDQFDPYDVSVPRRSFVEWMDRNLRAYSLGIRLQDARSGEILKGHVRIENLRVRQDALIAEALLGPFYEGAGAKSVVAAVESQVTIMQHLEQRLCKTNPVSIDSFGESETADPSVAATSLTTSPVVESILAAITQRVKQLGAHEVGHTLGLAHNFAGSSYSQGYASVMDYPPPIVTIDPTGTKLVLNEKSYGNRIGIFDKVAIDYGYRRLDANLTWAEQRAVLDDIIQNAVQKGYVFLTDQDTAAFGQDWRDTQWDSGTDPVRALNHSLQVRALALQKLTSSSVLPAHAPLSNLQELFPIVYLWHRYEVEAVAKLVGGSTFQYEMKEDIKSAGEMHPVPPAMQAVAITQLLEALSPAQLAIPDLLSSLLVPLAFGYSPDIGGMADLIATRTGAGTFDPISAIEIGANIVISAVLSAPRLERLAVQSQRNTTYPGVLQLLRQLTSFVFSVDTSRGVSQCDGSNTRLAQFTTQSVLANAYLSAMEPTADHSSHVRSLIKYHMQHVLANQLVLLKAVAVELCANTTALPTRCDVDTCADVSTAWQAHIEFLQSVNAAGKSFMVIPSPPLGPPI